ncbi:MAG: universal stress protein [Phycisphaeraceae bacterium]
MKKLLAAIDFSDASQRVLDAAVAEAEARGAGLVLVHAASPEPAFIGYEVGPACERDARADHLREEHRKLQAMAEACRAKGVEAKALLVAGHSAEKIIEEADAHDAAMIVLGSHGHGAVYSLIVGSVTSGVLKRSKRPVLVIPCGSD